MFDLGIMCFYRGFVFSYYYRYVIFFYETEDREVCNIFFIWEMLRFLLKGKYIILFNCLYYVFWLLNNCNEDFFVLLLKILFLKICNSVVIFYRISY